MWTRSGSGALRELGETFPWSPASRFAYLESNHNSVLGIREYARAHNASFGAVTEEDVEAWLAGGHRRDDGLPPVLQEAGKPAEGTADAGAGPQLGGGSSARRELRAQPAAAGTAGVALRPEAQAEPGYEAHRGRRHPAHDGDQPTYSLFAFPAYDNFAGASACLFEWSLQDRAAMCQAAVCHQWAVADGAMASQRMCNRLSQAALLPATSGRHACAGVTS